MVRSKCHNSVSRAADLFTLQAEIETREAFDTGGNTRQIRHPFRIGVSGRCREDLLQPAVCVLQGSESLAFELVEFLDLRVFGVLSPAQPYFAESQLLELFIG